MQQIRSSLLLAHCVLLAACSNGVDVETDEIAGTWDATHMVYHNSANPNETVDVISEGAEFFITFNANGSYSATYTAVEEAPETTTGTWEASIDVLTTSQTGMSFSTEYEFVLSGNTLTLTGGDVDYDWDGDDVDEPAELDLTMVRRQ